MADAKTLRERQAALLLGVQEYIASLEGKGVSSSPDSYSRTAIVAALTKIFQPYFPGELPFVVHDYTTPTEIKEGFLNIGFLSRATGKEMSYIQILELIE